LPWRELFEKGALLALEPVDTVPSSDQRGVPGEMYKKVERVSIKKTSPLCQFLEGDTPSGEFLHNLVATAGGPPPSAQVVCLRIESPNLIGCEIIVGHDSEPLVAWIDHVDGLGGDEDLRVVDVVLPGPGRFEVFRSCLIAWSECARLDLVSIGWLRGGDDGLLDLVP